MRKTLILSFLLLGLNVLAQPGVSPTKVIDGFTYYEHTVAPGNTLYGIQRMYDVTIEEIQDANPGLTENLSEGQKILIPIGKEEVTMEYMVQDKETLYGISRKFNTTVEKIKELNPILETTGLQKDQVILVPAPPKEYSAVDPKTYEKEVEPQDVTDNPFVNEDTTEVYDVSSKGFSDTTVLYTVLPHETLYSISKRFMVPVEELMRVNKLPSASIKEGQRLIIPVQQEEYGNVGVKTVNPFIEETIDSVSAIPRKDVYGIALMMPFFVEHGPGYSQYISDISTQFYMGALVAVDSLKKCGLNAKLYVYDTKNDTNRVKSIISKPEFQNIDLIIGPLYGKTVPVVAEYSKRTGKKMVCPLAVDKSVLRRNPNVYASVPSDVTLFNGLARHLAKSDYDRIVLIRPTDKEGGLLAESFKSTYLSIAENGKSPSISNADEINFADFVKKGSKVAFVYPCDVKVKVIKFMSRLNTAAITSKEGEVTIFGTKDWVNIEEINNVYKNKYNFHYPGPNYLDYYSDQMISMNDRFRERFNTDLTKVSIQSYDLLTYFACNFFGLNPQCKPLMNEFNMWQVDNGDGFENSSVFIIEQENFELIKRGFVAR